MSFAQQEQALLDLLFDRERRTLFRRDPVAALAPYELTEAERADFTMLRVEALELDAAARIGFILAQYCRSFPLAFSLTSSLPSGLDLLRSLIDAALMRTPPMERVSTFGLRLRDALRTHTGFTGAREQALVLSIVEAELGMAWTAQLARQAALEGTSPAGEETVAPTSDWLQRPLRLAPLTSAAILPRPYAALKAELCPCTGAELWRRLVRESLPPAQRQQVLATPDLRLLVARAVIARASPCEPVAEHVTVELGEGFARLLPHLDGQTGISTLLGQLRAAGADDALLAGVLAGFRQLWQSGMLQPAA